MIPMNRFSFARKRVFLLALLVFLVSASAGLAATLRGRLVAMGPQGLFPVGGIAVTVNSPSIGRSQPSFTGRDGMYYLNIPAGMYTLEVWYSRDPRVPPMLFQIQVREPLTDIQQIQLP
jgi:hypothetical protein